MFSVFQGPIVSNKGRYLPGSYRPWAVKLLCLRVVCPHPSALMTGSAPEGPGGSILDILYKCGLKPKLNPFWRSLFGKGLSDRAREPNLRIFKVKFIWGRVEKGSGALQELGYVGCACYYYFFT